MNSRLLQGYEEYIKEPAIFQSLGGAHSLFTGSLQRFAQENKIRGELWEDAFYVGRETEKEPSFMKGLNAGLREGHIEGIKQFITEGNKYVSVSADGAKSFKNIDEFFDSSESKLFKEQIGELKYPKKQTDETVKKLIDQKDTEIQTLQSQIKELPSQDIFKEAYEFVKVKDSNKKTTSRNRKGENKKLTSDIVNNNTKLETFEDRNRFMNDLIKYNNTLPNDWKENQELLKSIKSYVATEKQNIKSTKRIEQLQNEKKSLPFAYESDRLKQKTEYANSAAHIIKNDLSQMSAKLGDTPIYLSDTINLYNVEKIREKKTQDIQDWRTDKFAIPELKDYFFQPNARSSFEKPVFPTPEELDERISFIKYQYGLGPDPAFKALEFNDNFDSTLPTLDFDSPLPITDFIYEFQESGDKEFETFLKENLQPKFPNIQQEIEEAFQDTPIKQKKAPIIIKTDEEIQLEKKIRKTIEQKKIELTQQHSEAAYAGEDVTAIDAALKSTKKILDSPDIITSISQTYKNGPPNYLKQLMKDYNKLQKKASK